MQLSQVACYFCLTVAAGFAAAVLLSLNSCAVFETLHMKRPESLENTTNSRSRAAPVIVQVEEVLECTALA